MIVGEDFNDEMSEFRKEIESIPNTLNEGTPEFIKAYWDWWDSLTPNIRVRWDNNPADMSHVYFFNAVWRKRNDTNSSAT